MITAEQVKNLNKKIEEMNAQGNRAKAKLEVLEGNLAQSLSDYSSTYGVNLQGKTMKSTAANIQKEFASVEAAVQEEFNLRNAVVAAIERGDIDEANRLLGVEVVEEPDEDFDDDTAEETPVAGVTVEEDDSDSDTEGFGFDEDDSDDDEDGFSGLDGDGTVGDDDDVSPASFGFAIGNISLDDDDSDEEVPVPEPVPTAKAAKLTKTAKSSKKTGSNLGSSVDKAVSELEGGFEDVDLDDDDLEDFGFGNMLAGTKFSID